MGIILYSLSLANKVAGFVGSASSISLPDRPAPLRIARFIDGLWASEPRRSLAWAILGTCPFVSECPLQAEIWMKTPFPFARVDSSILGRCQRTEIALPPYLFPQAQFLHEPLPISLACLAASDIADTGRWSVMAQ